MNWSLKSRWRLPLALVCAVVTLFAGDSAQAASVREKNEFNAAAKAFADGFWDRAEIKFAEFIEKNPASELVAEAALLQAQAQIKQRKFAAGISLLTQRDHPTNRLADQFLFWTGEAQFQSTNFAAAADAFGELATQFENSPRRLEAAVGEASARAKLGEWPRVAGLLKKPDGAFQSAVRTSPESEVAARGLLLLAEAELQQRNYRDAEAALRLITAAQLASDLAWQKQFLLCRSQVGDGRAAAALDGSTNLMALAANGGRRDLLAESIAFRAGIFEQLGRLDEAGAAFKLNVTNAPPERQREAFAKIAELALAQNRPADAMQTLEWYLTQFTNSPATDMALLTLGELHLKQHVSPAGTNGVVTVTNHLSQAMANFDRLVSAFPASPLVGKALLDRGWCFWSEKKIPESAEAFQAAVARLSPSEDLAVARFKLADALYVQKDFTNALQNYRAAQEVAGRWPRVRAALASQSLYQELRANLELRDMPGATNVLRKILESHPQSMEADRSVLLVAQEFSDTGGPDEARACFEIFLKQFPDSALRPEVELALARVSEQKSDWAAAISQYDAWLERFATNGLRPQAEFHRALANFYSGNETNALGGMTNFVAKFPAHELAPSAQWWVADHFFRAGDFQEAEISYKKIFQDLPASALAYEARMMAGKLALERGGSGGYQDAILHFTNLTSNPNCPPGLKIQATFAYGGVYMRLDPGGTNKLANYQEAIRVFATIPQLHPGTEAAALAWGEIGGCSMQLANQDEAYYGNATNAFQQVIASPQAGIAARSQAKVGLARVAEQQAASRSGPGKSALLKVARDHYLDVFYPESLLRAGESPDWFWVKEAGLGVAKIIEATAETADDWMQTIKIYRDLQRLLPSLHASLEKMIARAQERLPQGKN